MFNDGEIKGANFGATRGSITLHVRVRPPKRSGVYEQIADQLLGGLRPSNYPNLDDKSIQKWSDTTIQLKFPTGYKDFMVSLVNQKAESRGLAPPVESGLEVGYQITGQNGISDWFYP